MRNQYFMYGILVPYKTYLDLKLYNTIDDVLKVDDGIQGIFTGRDNDFMIIGKLLETIDIDDHEPHPVPLLSEVSMQVVRNKVSDQYDLRGEFHYYFITK